MAWRTTERPHMDGGIGNAEDRGDLPARRRARHGATGAEASAAFSCPSGNAVAARSLAAADSLYLSPVQLAWPEGGRQTSAGSGLCLLLAREGAKETAAAAAAVQAMESGRSGRRRQHAGAGAREQEGRSAANHVRGANKSSASLTVSGQSGSSKAPKGSISSDISAAGAARSSGTHVCAGDTEADWIAIARRREKGTERVEATGGSKGRASTGGGGERLGAAGHQAFEAAWAAACKVEASTVLVPSELEFAVGPISFSGPYCKPNILFQLDGTILAQTSARVWGSGLLQWLEFTKLTGIAIQGSGVINGRGQEWWTYSDPNDDDDNDAFRVELDKMPQIKPTALRFYGSSNVTVTGITIVNSSQCHLKFDSCQGVMVHDLTISSPENSPNTDGIHLQNSRQVNIHHTNMACGDDCVSIQTGCSDINIHNVNCGPGHGISIGGLGRYNTKACVSNVTVRDVNMYKTMNGVRIKTWQGGSGLVQGIRFSNIQVSEVQTPIIIDQFYCDKTTCRNQTSAVAVSGVQYENIRGTFTIKPAHFACSDNSPCSDITLTGIQLKPMTVPQYHLYNPFCWQAFGMLYTPTVPPISCLQIGKPAGNSVLSDGDLC
ncbi:polygalacturonase [Panicum miliaceum]|uniref:Polygalacturonase n=1 Tax=Panicum miliaceum TaxID=4540 RepID=A0A3L6RCV4_PANMI|nr:polygalacturonase [Panicum miliaceum]